MRTGLYTLTVLLCSSIVATAIADLGFMHAGNEAWPPHARFHAVWNVAHVALTHAVALGVLWYGPGAGSIGRVRVATLILLAYVTSFFGAAAVSSLFGASTHPDLPVELRPPTLFGLDGNTLGFLAALPVIGWAWWRCERDCRTVEAQP